MRWLGIIIVGIHFFCLNVFAQGLISPKVVLQVGHSEWVTAVAVSTDNKLVASASLDTTVKLYDIISGRLIRTFYSGKEPLKSVLFANNGKTIIAGGRDGTIIVWDIYTGNCISTWKTTELLSMALSPDGNMLAVGGRDGKIRVWETSSAKSAYVIPGHSSEVTSLIYVSNTVIASSGGDGTIRVWDITAKRVLTINAHQSRIHSIAIMPNLQYVISGSADGTVKVWDMQSGQLVRTFVGHNDAVLSVAYSQDADLIASSGADNEIRIWNIHSEKPRAVIKGHSNPVSAVAFIDSHLLVSGSWDNTVRFWNVQGEEVKMLSSFTDWITAIAISPDASLVAAGTEGKVLQFWDLSKGKVKLLADHNGAVFAVAFSPNGKFLASGGYDKTIRLWSIPDLSLIKTLKGHTEGIQSLAFSSDSSLLVSSSGDGTVRLWNVNSGALVHIFKGHNGTVDCVKFSPNRKIIASAGYDRTVRLWDIATKKLLCVLQGHNNRVCSLAFSPDGLQIASGGVDEKLCIWDVTSRQCVAELTGHTNTIYSVTYSPDGSYIITGSGDGTIKYWNATTKRLEKNINVNSYVIACAVSNDSKFLLWGGKDCAVHVLDFATAKERAQCMAMSNAEWAIVTPDCYYMCNKSTLTAIHFVMGLRAFGFDQYDLWYNRPDKVLANIGKATSELIDAYYHAYLKRLKKMNIDLSQLGKEFISATATASPSIETDRTYRNVVTDQPYYLLRFTAQDPMYSINRIFIKVNGVPLYGVQGKVLPSKTKELLTTETIPLSVGENIIKFSVLNEKGIESPPAIVHITYKPKQSVKPDLYLLAIGVSKFIQSEYNLTYADKDAKDVVQLFEQRKERFGAIKTVLLVNEQATRENILQFRKMIHSTKPDDYVVVFIASHGLLDENYDYYIATHDIDFLKPQEKGIKYGELENLLDGILARHKLIFIDACHSGELDKEELQGAQQIKKEGNIAMRGFTIVNKKKVMGLSNSFDLMRELFADLKRGNGSIVISSAGGLEFAYESPQWRNGVFTYSMIEGIKLKKADINKDGIITVIELMDYIANRTQQLTKGKQNPVMRKENVEVNFAVW